MNEIGFRAPENPDKTWEKQIDGRSYVFSKTREKSGVFLYHLQLKGTDTGSGFKSDRDMTPEEIEQHRHFVHLLEALPEGNRR